MESMCQCSLAVMLLTMCFFSAGLCLLVATNVMSVYSQNSKCEGSRINVAKHGSSGLACAIPEFVMRRGFCSSVLSLK